VNVSTFPLIDGPLCEPRDQLIARMAADLVRFDAFHNREDAVRALMWRKDYSPFLVMRFADDARQVAMQDVVAREMAAS
jgi:hypothetical protein